MSRTVSFFAALALLGVSAVGCTPYWLVCDIQRVEPRPGIQFRQLRDSVAAAARDFGYELVSVDERARSKLKSAEFRQTGRMSPAIAALKGSRARVDLGVGGWNGNMIAIQDFDNAKETEFVRALKQHIRQQLERDFGLKQECFERQWSPFAP
jgi:hypothetical protein